MPEKPGQRVFTACIIPLIPGGMLYYTMLEMVQGNWTQAAQQGIATLKSAGAIAIGLAALPPWKPWREPL